MTDDLSKRRDTVNSARTFEVAHTAIDAAIGSSAVLINHLLEVRARHVSGIAGQAILEGMLDGLGTLAAARKQLIHVHADVGEFGRTLGLEVRSEGSGAPKPAVIQPDAEQVGERRAA